VLFPEIMRLLKDESAGDIVVFAGGIIPEKDIPKMKAIGIREIFLPGTPTATAVDAIRRAVNV
jgi:methylmalonyl-CoA mutase C-terminal domain/subunit